MAKEQEKKKSTFFSSDDPAVQNQEWKQLLRAIAHQQGEGTKVIIIATVVEKPDPDKTA